MPDKIKLKIMYLRHIFHRKKNEKFKIKVWPMTRLLYFFLAFTFIFAQAVFLLAQAPPPPPPPPPLDSSIKSEFNSFQNKLESLKQKFASLEQEAAEVLRPVYLVYGNEFVPNVVNDKIDIEINNFTKEKYKNFTELYRKLLESKYPDLKDDFIGVLGEEVSVLYTIGSVGKIQNAIGYYLKAMNIDLDKASKEVADNAKCFLEKISNVPSDVKNNTSKGLDYAIGTFRCLMGVLRGLSDFRDFNAWMEAIGGTFSRYLSSNALMQTIANFSTGGNFDSSSNYPKELHSLIEPAKQLREIAKQADMVAKLKNFAGKAAYNFFADLINAPGNDDAKIAIALFPIIMENIYNSYYKFVQGLKSGISIKSLNVGYKPINQQGNAYNYEFDSGVNSACLWIIEQGGQKKDFDSCRFNYESVNQSDINYKVWGIGSPAFAQGIVKLGQSQNAKPPSGNGGADGGNNEQIFDEDCSIACPASHKCLRDKENKIVRCVNETFIDENCAIECSASGRCLRDEQNTLLKCLPKEILKDCSVFYNKDKTCTAGLIACCEGLGKRCVGGICSDKSGPPPILSKPCQSAEDLAKCDPNTEKCIDDGKGNAICVPKDYEPGKQTPGGCAKNPEPKPGEVIIPNPLCDAHILELIKRIASWLQMLAIVIAPLIFIVGGILYMTSGGNPEKVKRASLMMAWAAVGFAIILLSFGLVEVIKSVIGAK